MRWRWFLGVTALVAAVVALLPWLLNSEDYTREEFVAAHKERAHQFAELSGGVTHYELRGRKEQPLVVLIHGVSGPLTVWDRTVDQLGQAGFRTLRLDLYGRGLSARPKVDYDLSLYITQVRELVDAVAGKQASFFVVGSSMGAIIAAELASTLGNRIGKVALIGPAGFPIQASASARFLRWPLIGDYIMRTFGHDQLIGHNRRYYYRPGRFLDEQERFAEQLHVKGSKRAVLSTMRHTPVQSFLDGYARLGKTGKPVLCLWGRQDQTFPFSNHSELEKRVPGLELIAIDEAAHLPQLERADLVGPALIGFLQR